MLKPLQRATSTSELERTLIQKKSGNTLKKRRKSKVWKGALKISGRKILITVDGLFVARQAGSNSLREGLTPAKDANHRGVQA